MSQDLRDQQLSQLRMVAVEASQAAAVPIRTYFERQNFQIITKKDGSPVTQADREAEAMIREHLSSKADCGPLDILGEEEGLQGKGTRWRWVVDPIDGTRSFIHGIPLFGTIIALFDTQEQIPVLGVIHLPLLGLTYDAARGQGANCQGKTFRLSTDSAIGEPLIGVGDIAQFVDAQCEFEFQRLQTLSKYVRAYTDCFGHTLVIRGSVGAMMDPALNPWDILATQVLIEEVGGRMMLRPSRVPQKMDALFGHPGLVKTIAHEIHF